MNVGIIVPHLGASQLAYLAINQANLWAKNSKHNMFLFYEDLVRPCVKVDVAAMNLNEIWNFKGLLIATTLSSASYMINAVCPSSKVFYTWDLEFMRKEKDFLRNSAIYRDETIRLYARSKSHQAVLENYSNRKVERVLPNLDIMEMINDELRTEQ
jgi:hypothetical protein